MVKTLIRYWYSDRCFEKLIERKTDGKLGKVTLTKDENIRSKEERIMNAQDETRTTSITQTDNVVIVSRQDHDLSYFGIP